MATPPSILKKPEMVLLPEKKMELADLKLGMLIQLYSANNMGWVPSGHTSSSFLFVCKAKKCLGLNCTFKRNTLT